MKGFIFNVRRYSIHDGPGIRVTFFMKGCPLKCIWCHNPEGINPGTETVIQSNRIGPYEFKRKEDVGKFYAVEDILGILDKERIFINQSKGGVTFSGGEPLMQAEFLREALEACKGKGYHTAVDTSGYASAENYRSVIPYTDLFLFDLKHLDDAQHKAVTGVSNKSILKNLRLLMDCGKDVMIRVPLIPGINDDKQNLAEMKQLLTDWKAPSLKKINLLPYHKIGSSKYNKFNIPYMMDGILPPSQERMNELKEFFSETGITIKIGG